jgi:PIN domain nuclease of toxin-antitoxin system
LTDTVLLDTHIALWLGSGDERLRTSTLNLIDSCWRNGGTILLSAITAWEIAQLVSYGRIVLDRPVEDWMERLGAFPGTESIPLTHRAAMGAYQLQDFDNRDPADRLLIATAIERDCPLITYDSRIVQFARSHGSQYGFATAA